MAKEISRINVERTSTDEALESLVEHLTNCEYVERRTIELSGPITVSGALDQYGRNVKTVK
ncbi:MAG TPA: hypothetical protein VJZ93_02960, partial [Candidatus Nanoarchaeia archaeon]|nr:hypothetical protein [Candidatus Nanoarchaeia archaeon]